MDIEEVLEEKYKMEFLIRDSLNAFMRETKTKVERIDIGHTTYEPATGSIQIVNIELSLTL